MSTWIQENVLTPVERFVTQAREACEEVRTWVEEQVQRPVENWVSQTERRCREQDCNWWCACCNKWFCWLVTVVVRVVTWVVVTVGKWVAHLVCKIVVTVIGIVVELVLKVVSRLVTFFVCLFTDPIKALSALWDLVNDVVDALDDVLGLVVELLDDVGEIIRDVGRLLEGLGRSFCIYGDGACALFGAIFGFFKAVTDWLADVVDWVRDTVDGVRDLVLGILSLDWCRMQRGLGIFNVLRLVTSVTRLLGMLFYVGPRQLVDRRGLEATMDSALTQALLDDPERLERARTRAGIGGAPLGTPATLDPWRLAVRSGEFLRELHTSGVLDLYAVAGRFSDCQGKFTYDQLNGEVVYTGTRTTVSKTDIDDFLELGADAVPSFTVHAIDREVFQRHLQTARRKALTVGVRFSTRGVRELPVEDARFVPLDAGESSGATQRTLLELVGRNARDEDLTVVPVLAVFGYVDTSLHGLASSHRGEVHGPTGTTFRSRFPEVVFEYVPIHEVGHYLGLDHEGHTHAGQIMWKPALGNDWGQTLLTYLLGSGEADFTGEDATAVWLWLTTTPEALADFFP
ncbi:hypothetical protein J1G42_14295 [Cellulomonas sp. zg-ZUI222]|uniref:hypothetical protein n=1 Tax=Cellulomonas wangleii TaxID=2816956 RepID=UPI001A94120E|nr:hypothetical protein [Cellulomonas wangleii]MBO0921992.1 hypothetical protein [Cellulomonas wangleii]